MIAPQRLFAQLLRNAAAAVTAEYIALPRHLPTSTEAAEGYLERGYCYELYHQMRALMDAARDDDLAEAVAAGWRINGEVDKATSYIPGRRVPDFIWHVPGGSENGHVLEVKRSKAPIADIRADVQKLRQFGLDAGYECATLLIVGPHHGVQFGDILRAAKEAHVEVLFHRAEALPLATG